MLLKVCLNGARLPNEHPALKTEPGFLASELRGAVAAGAGAAHLHAKDSLGRDSLAGADIARYLSAARTACPTIPLGVTTGAWVIPARSDRLAAIGSWKDLPDFVSLNWHEDGADEIAECLIERGIGIEAGVWHRGGFSAWESSPSRGQCLRVLVEIPDIADLDEIETTARDLVETIRAVEPQVPVLLHGEGRSTWPALDLAARWGLDTRIGLEDTLHLPDGRLATNNEELVHAAVSRLHTRR